MSSDISRIQNYLEIVLRVADLLCDENTLPKIAQQGWSEREKAENEQTEYAHVCWASELFAAAELLRRSVEKGMEFTGPASILYFCAIDAIRGRQKAETVIKETLQEAFNLTKKQARNKADELRIQRNAGVHKGITDHLVTLVTVQVGETCVFGKTVDEVFSVNKGQQRKGPILAIQSFTFSDNHSCVDIRQISAFAIAKIIKVLSSKISKHPKP